MKYRKIMTAIASMTMAGVMLAGCSSNSTSGTSSTGSGSAAGNSTASSGGSESTAGSEKVSLTVWGPQEDQELIKKMCDEFAAANPEKTYTFTYGVVSEADAQKEVNKDISAAADVFAFASDQTAILVNAGALYRVTKNKDQIVAENSEASISAASINGELYGYPYVSDTYFMYYDKSKLTEDDVKSIKALCRRISTALQQTSLSIQMTAGIRQASSSAQAASCSVMTEPIPQSAISITSVAIW